MGEVFSTKDVQEKYQNADEETKRLINGILQKQSKIAEEKDQLLRFNKILSENEVKLKSDIAKLLKTTEKLNKSIHGLTDENDRLKREMQHQQSSAKQKTPKEFSDTGVFNTTKMVEECLRQQKKLETEKLELTKRIEGLEKENTDVYNDNKRLRDESKILSSEKESALSRLSKIAGIQLTKGNTEIADLSDANRPTSLAEKWSNLYTDEWSEAYNEMTMGRTIKNENCRVEKELCKIVMICYTICQKMELKQITDIKSHAWDIACCLHQQPDQLVSSAQTTQYHKVNKASVGIKGAATMEANPNLRAGPEIDKILTIQKCMEELIQIVMERRRYDKKLLEYVIQETVRQFGNYAKPGSKGQVIAFVKRSTELCWSMVIKEPPMVLVHDQMEGKPIDKNLFTFYTKNGPVIDFVIWPALILKKNGPVLAKGSAQGKDTGQTLEAKHDQAKKQSLNESKTAPIKQDSENCMKSKSDAMDKTLTVKDKNKNEQ